MTGYLKWFLRGPQDQIAWYTLRFGDMPGMTQRPSKKVPQSTSGSNCIVYVMFWRHSRHDWIPEVVP